MLAVTKDRAEPWVVAAIAAHAMDSGEATKLLDMVGTRPFGDTPMVQHAQLPALDPINPACFLHLLPLC